MKPQVEGSGSGMKRRVEIWICRKKTTENGN